MNTKLFLNLFLFAVVLGISMQLLVQTALSPPLQDAALIGKHLNTYDIEMNYVKKGKAFTKGGTQQQQQHDQHHVPINHLKQVVEASNPVEEGANSKREAFVKAATVPSLDFLLTVDELGSKYGFGADLDNNKARDLYLEVLKDTKAGFDAWLATHMEDREQAIRLRELEAAPAEKGKRPMRGTAHSALPSPADTTVDEELEHAAVLCSVARSRTRRYVRDRMSDRVGAWGLFVRDAWQYGGKDLAWAIASDVKTRLANLVNGGVSEAEEQKVIGKAQLFKAKKNRKRKGKRSQSILDDGIMVSGGSDADGDSEDYDSVSKSGAALASIGACLSAEDGHPCPSFSYLLHIKQKDAKAILKSCFASNEHYNRFFATSQEKREGSSSPDASNGNGAQN